MSGLASASLPSSISAATRTAIRRGSPVPDVGRSASRTEVRNRAASRRIVGRRGQQQARTGSGEKDATSIRPFRKQGIKLVQGRLCQRTRRLAPTGLEPLRRLLGLRFGEFLSPDGVGGVLLYQRGERCDRPVADRAGQLQVAVESMQPAELRGVQRRIFEKFAVRRIDFQQLRGDIDGFLQIADASIDRAGQRERTAEDCAHPHLVFALIVVFRVALGQRGLDRVVGSVFDYRGGEVAAHQCHLTEIVVRGAELRGPFELDVSAGDQLLAARKHAAVLRFGLVDPAARFEHMADIVVDQRQLEQQVGIALPTAIRRARGRAARLRSLLARHRACRDSSSSFRRRRVSASTRSALRHRAARHPPARRRDSQPPRTTPWRPADGPVPVARCRFSRAPSRAVRQRRR